MKVKTECPAAHAAQQWHELKTQCTNVKMRKIDLWLKLQNTVWYTNKKRMFLHFVLLFWTAHDGYHICETPASFTYRLMNCELDSMQVIIGLLGTLSRFIMTLTT